MALLDLSIYYPIPLLTTEGFVSMTNTMLDVAPSDPPGHVELAIKDLAGVLSEVEAGLVSRIDEDVSTRLERAFDIFVDGVWLDLRSRLEFYGLYKHEGTAKFTDEDLEELDFDHRLDKARSAAKILGRLFGDGTDFLRDRYPQQATHMAARLDWVQSKDLDAELSELVTHDFTVLLKVCQNRYEAMVSERSSRDGKSTADLRELRNKLRCQLYSYCGAVGSMYQPGDPETAKVIEAALRPILIVRAQARRKAASFAAGDEVDFADETGDLDLAAGEDAIEGDPIAPEAEPDAADEGEPPVDQG